MHSPLYDVKACRKTIRVTWSADPVALRLAISRIAETAIIEAFEAAEKATIREELREATSTPFDDWANHGRSDDADHAA